MFKENIDFVKKCSRYSVNTLFPKNVKNKEIVYTINIIHVIGVLYIQLGILLPVWTLKYYVLYCTFLMITYVLLKNRCFMSIMSNYYSETNYNLLCIKMDKAKTFLAIYLLLAILFISYPQYAPFNIIKGLVS
jgi:hypothetical protein